MTEYSYYHNGVTVGDAGEAPYTVTLFKNLLNTLYDGEGFIAGGDVNGWEVSFNAGQVVNIAAGKAFIKGVYCENTLSTTLTLEDNSSGFPRIDLVAIQIDWNNEEISLIAKKGIPASSPSVPVLEQVVGGIYEQSLAMCYVPDSFTGFDNTYIYDMRKFLDYYDSSNIADIPFRMRSVMHNSTFIAGTTTSWSGSLPAMWETYGTPDLGATFIDGVRGRTMQTTITNAPRTLGTELYLNANADRICAIRFMLEVVSGTCHISDDGGGSVIRKYQPAAEPYEVLIYGTYGTTGGREKLVLQFIAGTASCTIKLSEVTVSPGIIVVPPQHQRETILFGRRVFLLDSQTAGIADGNYFLNLDEVYRDTSALLLAATAFDSGSAAANNIYISLKPKYAQYTTNSIDALRVELGGLLNNDRRELTGWVGVSKDATDQIEYEVDGSGSSTLRTIIGIVGITT